jgi:RNA polymerase sigma-70 factor, ECF subfamily
MGSVPAKKNVVAFSRPAMENTQKLVALPSDDAEAMQPLASSPVTSKSESELEALVICLFDKFQGRVLNYVLTCGLPFHDAEDVVQETFLSLFRHLELGRPRSNLNGWLFRVAHNLALKRRKSSLPFEANFDPHKILARQMAPGLSPESQFAFGQMHQRLHAVFEALPDQEQRCLYLRAEGLKYRDIAQVLDISLGTVSASLSRALARMVRAARS